jgi:copper homeostasis protein
MHSNIIIEICCADIQSVILAAKYKADAIELCVDLEHGGLTPSISFIKKSRDIFRGELAVFFRPRNGSFIYDTEEKDILLNDMSHSLDAGIDTIVAGGLNSDYDLDTSFMKEIITVSRGCTIEFHRAIDIARDPISLINQLTDYQIDRLLSSGRAKTAAEGINTLKNWNDQFGDKIQIMAAGGINSGNILQILETSGIKRFHASLRKSESVDNPVMKLGSREKADEESLKLLMKAFNRL